MSYITNRNALWVTFLVFTNRGSFLFSEYFFIVCKFESLLSFVTGNQPLHVGEFIYWEFILSCLLEHHSSCSLVNRGDIIDTPSDWNREFRKKKSFRCRYVQKYNQFMTTIVAFSFFTMWNNLSMQVSERVCRGHSENAGSNVTFSFLCS